MSLYKQWLDLMEGQTDETFEAFWKEYSETETRIYKDLLAHHTEITKGTFKELAEKYEADPVIFMGFLDGIDTSLKASNDFKTFDENSEIVLDIDFEKLFFNMLVAEAQYLYTLEEWEDVLENSLKLTQEEYDAVLSYLYLLELDNGYTQDFSAATAEYIPDFDLEGL